MDFCFCASNTCHYTTTPLHHYTTTTITTYAHYTKLTSPLR